MSAPSVYWCTIVAQREGIRLFEVQPVDESLASVFSYLVGK